jgi:hypothetical protein
MGIFLFEEIRPSPGQVPREAGGPDAPRGETSEQSHESGWRDAKPEETLEQLTSVRGATGLRRAEDHHVISIRSDDQDGQPEGIQGLQAKSAIALQGQGLPKPSRLLAHGDLNRRDASEGPDLLLVDF